MYPPTTTIIKTVNYEKQSLIETFKRLSNICKNNEQRREEKFEKMSNKYTIKYSNKQK